MLPQLKELVIPLKENFLNHQNYEEWRCYMTWSLISHDLWHVVRGHRLSEITLDHDSLVTRAIKLTIGHPYSLKIWQASFLSSQELWDYLRSEFGQKDSIELKFQRQEQKKMKKRAKQKQRKLKQRELADFLILPVPEIQDSDSISNCFEDVLAKLPCMANPEHNRDILEQSSDSLAIQTFLADADHVAGFNATSYLGTSMEELLDFPRLLSEDIQQLEVPIFDEFLDFADLSSMAQTVLSDYVDKEVVLECIPESSLDCQTTFFDFDLQHEVVEYIFFLDKNAVTDLFSGEEQDTGITQEFMAEEEELISELPWLEIDSKTSDFKSVLSQVSDHELPCYVNVHIPFACPHDGKVADQHLDDFSWYISYVDSEGIAKQLQVSSRCLHLRNQFLVAGQNVEQVYDTHTWLEACYGRYPMNHFGIAGTRGTIDTFDILSAREWYRGRKIWSKIKDKGHSWILLWLSLLYFTSTA